MRKASIWCILLITLSVASMSFAETKEGPDGFRGIKWGDPVSVLGNKAELIVVNPDNNTELYSRKGEKLKIGSTNFSRIAYVFLDNKLFAVTMEIQDPANITPLKKAIFERFGYPDIEDNVTQSYAWGGNVGIVRLSRERLDFFSREIMGHQVQKDHQSEEAASSDF